MTKLCRFRHFVNFTDASKPMQLQLHFFLCFDIVTLRITQAFRVLNKY